MSEGRGTFRSEAGGARCEIEFSFSGEEATLRQPGDPADCGFGHGISANGVYHRKSRKPPPFSKGEGRRSE